MDSNRITEVLQLAADTRTNEDDKKALIEMLLAPLDESEETIRKFVPTFFLRVLKKEPEKAIPALLPLFVFLHQKQGMQQLHPSSPL